MCNYTISLILNFSELQHKLNRERVKVTEKRNNLKETLTVGENGIQHPETTETARLISPHPHYPETGVQHDIISNCTTKLGLQETTHLFFLTAVLCVVSLRSGSLGQLLYFSNMILI